MDEQTQRQILDKAEFVREAVTVLADRRNELSFTAYRESRTDRAVVEREFQTAIEACIDIGELVLTARGIDVPETNAEVFRTLGRIDVLDGDTAGRMAQAAGFRNVLAHRYGTEIDDRAVYDTLQSELPLFKTYLEAIRATLDSDD